MSVIQRDLKTIKGDRIPIKQVDIIILILRIQFSCRIPYAPLSFPLRIFSIT